MNFLNKLLLSAVMLGLITSAAIAQDAASQVKAEIERQQKSLKDQPVKDPDWADLASSSSDAFKAANNSLVAGRFFLSLEQFGQAEDLLQAARTAADNQAVVKNGLPAFEQQWGKVSLQLTALDKQAHEKDWKNSPAVIQALAEAAQTKAIPLLEGGRGFATATGPKDGLLYVGQAQGEAEFARFCASLNLPRTKTAIPLRSLLPELQMLQDKTNAAFQPPKSIDLHSRFIALNSTIKLAKELDSNKFYAGALYQYLEAVRHYGMLSAPTLDAAGQATVQKDLASAQKVLAASTRDDSIAQLFLERAQSYIAHPDNSPSTPDEWRSARIILDQLLPAYAAALQPAGPLQQVAGKTVDITLVRWPYT